MDKSSLIGIGVVSRSTCVIMNITSRDRIIRFADSRLHIYKYDLNVFFFFLLQRLLKYLCYRAHLRRAAKYRTANE